MAGPLGLNIAPVQTPTPATVRPAAPRLVRVPLWPQLNDFTLRAYTETARIPVLGVVDRNALGGSEHRADWPNRVKFLAQLRAPLLAYVQAGNEWRNVGASSFTLTDGDQAYLIDLVADEFRAINPRIVVVAGADATGNPAGAFAALDHEATDLIAAHFYWESGDAMARKVRDARKVSGKRVLVTETNWDAAAVAALLAESACAGVIGWWHEPALPAVLGIAGDGNKIAEFRRLADGTQEEPSMPTATQYAVGQGVKDAMARNGDTPKGNEAYISASYSLTPGEKAAYLYSGEANQVYQLPRVS